MWLSSKTRYGLKAMYELGVNYGRGPIPLKYIAEKHSISLNYLEQIISLLKKAELITSIRGAQGGYKLINNPNDIIIGDIIRVLEGSIAPTKCTEKSHSACNYATKCVTKDFWTEINEKLNNIVDSMNLQDMIEKYDDKQ